MRKVRIQERKGRQGLYVFWRDEYGKEHCKGGMTQREADMFATRKRAELNADVYTGQIGVTWDRMVDEYRAELKALQLSPNSTQEIERTLDHFARIEGDLNSRQITQQVVTHFLGQRGAEPRQREIKSEESRNRPISRATLNKDARNLQTFLAWAQRGQRRYIKHGIEARRIKVAKRVPKPLNCDQVRELLIAARARSECWWMRLLLLLTTGLRAGDVEMLTVADIDFGQGCIDTKSRKTGKQMLYRPVPPKVMPILERYVAELPTGQVRLLVADSNTHKKWRQIRQRAGLPGLRLQDLRVTYSTTMQARGASLRDAQQLLEHSDARTTSQHYTNVNAVLQEAVNRLPVDEWL